MNSVQKFVIYLTSHLNPLFYENQLCYSFIFTHLVCCQQEIIAVKDSDEVEESEKIKKIHSIFWKKNKKRKSSAIFIKPMSDVTINDYKIMYLDGTEESVDASYHLKEYSFNF